MTRKEKDKLLVFVRELAKPHLSEETLIQRSELDSLCSFGNCDDVFTDGGDQVEANIALRARELLKNLIP